MGFRDLTGASDWVPTFVDELEGYVGGGLISENPTREEVEENIDDCAWEIMNRWCECSYAQLLECIGNIIDYCYDWEDCDFGCTNLAQVLFWGYYQIYWDHHDAILEQLLINLGLEEDE